MNDEGGAFGPQLRALRLDAGLSQQELAEKSGLSVRAISDLERGRTRQPYRRSVSCLADALELPDADRRELLGAAARRLGHSPSASVTAAAPAAAADEGSTGGGAQASRRRIVPRQLPAPVAAFVGRRAILADLSRALARPDATGIITAIGGTAGVGKTALALCWAHQSAARFPDGQLYVNLHGYDSERPMSAADALAGFLRALGVAGADIPADLDERAAAYRSRVAGRRMLVVLDNAGQVEQVRPLLPGSAHCVALVTSRSMLAGLVARDGAHRVLLDLLPRAEAVDLLRQLLGARVDAEPDAAAALADRCCRLPLALRVAAELAAARPEVSLGALAEELADLQQRLDLLDAEGDARTAVRSVLSWSYLRLDEDARRMFRLSCLHPAAFFDSYAVAALTGSTPQRAQRRMDELARAHLVQRVGPNRYGMHDLLRAYGRERASAEDEEGHRRAALTCLFDYCLRTAGRAMDLLYPAETARRPHAEAVSVAAPPHPLADRAAALAWLDAERSALVAVAAHAADRGWRSHATDLAAVLFRYLDAGGHVPEAMAIHACARAAAAQAGDVRAEAVALTNLGIAQLRQNRAQTADEHFQQALKRFREGGDRDGEARVLHNLSVVDHYFGSYQHAADHLQQALALYVTIGDRLGEARTASSLGIIERRQGRYGPALEHLRSAVQACRAIGDRLGEAEATLSLGIVDLRRGDWARADAHQRQALDIFCALGDRNGEAEALANLGVVASRQGDHRRAADHENAATALYRALNDRHGEAESLTNLGLIELRRGRLRQAAQHSQHALVLHRELGDRFGQADTLNGLGEVYLSLRRLVWAQSRFAAALSLAEGTGDAEQRARAHHGLGEALTGLGDFSEARTHWEQALGLYAAFGTPEAALIRSRLDLQICPRISPELKLKINSEVSRDAPAPSGPC
jgi:tetratricopeptide (TPR) repeat protein/transcriptional regulator with XRE-family HTH domain